MPAKFCTIRFKCFVNGKWEVEVGTLLQNTCTSLYGLLQCNLLQSELDWLELNNTLISIPC